MYSELFYSRSHHLSATAECAVLFQSGNLYLKIKPVKNKNVNL